MMAVELMVIIEGMKPLPLKVAVKLRDDLNRAIEEHRMITERIKVQPKEPEKEQDSG